MLIDEGDCMYEDLKKFLLWGKSHELVLEIYRRTDSFPKHELFGLVSQMRRAAVSVPSNIIEGKARDSIKEYIRFLKIARGSLEELKYQLFLSKDLSYLSVEDYKEVEELANEVGKLMHGLLKSLRS